MRTTLQLPERYESTGELDLSKNRSLKWKINAAALVLMAAFIFYWEPGFLRVFAAI